MMLYSTEPAKDSWILPKRKYKELAPYRSPTNNIICSSCGEDSGIPRILWMVIPAEGLNCQRCGEKVVSGPTVTW